VQGLATALHDHPQLPGCLVKRMYAFGTGGALATGEDPAVTALEAQFQQSGYRVPALMRAIAMADAFSDVADETPEAAERKTASLSSTNAAK